MSSDWTVTINYPITVIITNEHGISIMTKTKVETLSFEMACQNKNFILMFEEVGVYPSGLASVCLSVCL